MSRFASVSSQPMSVFVRAGLLAVASVLLLLPGRASALTLSDSSVIGPVPGSPASIAFDFDLGGMLTDVSSVVVTVDSCEVDLDVLCNDSLGRAEPVVLVLGPDAFALGAPAFAWPEAVETPASTIASARYWVRR